MLTDPQVTATTTSSFKGRDGAKHVPVNITPHKKILKLSFQDTGKYAGIVKNTAVSRLLREFCVTLHTKLITPTLRPKADSRTKGPKVDLPGDYAIRVILYGLNADQNAIGDILGDSGLCLQHPSAAKYNRLVPYHNPHYLLSPGSQIPQVEALRLKNSNKTAEQNTLNESTKGRYIGLFNETGNDIACRTDTAIVKPSNRLRSTLRQ